MKGFHDNKPKDDKICIYTHNGGTCQVKNALRNLPKEVRQRVEVVAISPATIIPKELCYQVDHYGTKGAPGAPLFDHSITSPTFETPIKINMTRFSIQSGGNK